MFLSELKKGDHAQITNITSKSLSTIRLISIGFKEGKDVKMVSKAPFTGPLLIDFDGQLICIRFSEGNLIRIKKIEINYTK